MKSSDFTAKGTSLRESTSFEPFCVKIGWGIWPPGVSRKKGQKVSDTHRNDVSPLTQGLRYRAACDATRGHILRAFYASHIQINCLNSVSLDPLPDGFQMEEGNLEPKSFQRPLPDHMATNCSCSCVRCATSRCLAGRRVCPVQHSVNASQMSIFLARIQMVLFMTSR